MKEVFLVIYVPVGGNTGDVSVLGAFSTRRKANAYLHEIVEEGYHEDEVYVEAVGVL